MADEESESGLLLGGSGTVYDLPLPDLFIKLHTHPQLGSQYTHSQRVQLRSELGPNLTPSPVQWPAWLCCLLPCLLKTKTMKYFLSLQVKAVQALRNGQYVWVDATGLLPGDVIRVSEGMHVPADTRILQVESEPCMFDTRAVTGEGVCFSEREGSVCVTGNDTVQCSIEEGRHTTASASSVSVSHHCTSSYYGNVLDPVNNLNIAFTGFLCTKGSFVGVVVTTGAETLLAKMIKRKEWPPMR